MVGFRNDIDNKGFVFANALEAMINAWWDFDDHGVMVSCEKFIHTTVRRRVFTVVVTDNFHHATHHAKIIFLVAMIMPGFGDLGIGCGEIDLAKFTEKGFVATQDFHQVTTFICVDR